jgi:peptidyl-prolyl cis-trans isomerase D
MPLFAPDAIEKKRNTEAVEVGTQPAGFGPHRAVHPAHTRPLPKSKTRAPALARAARRAEARKKKAWPSWPPGRPRPASATGLAAPIVVSREQTQKLPVPLIDAALRADASALPAFAGVDLGEPGLRRHQGREGGALAMRRLKPPPNSSATSTPSGGQSAENLAYYNSLKDRFKAEITGPKPAQAKANAEEVVTQ